MGDVDLRGTNHFDFAAVTTSHAWRGETEIEIERDGERLVLPYRARGLAFPWSRIPILATLALVGTIVLLRAPASSDSRLLFAAFTSFAIFQALFSSESLTITYVGIAVFHLGGAVAIALVAAWVIRFPPGLPPERRLSLAWAVGAGVLVMLPRLSLFFGWPLPPGSVNTQTYAAEVVVASAALVTLSWNYACADPVGRRRIRWVVLGAYLALLPLIASTLLGVLVPGFEWFPSCTPWASWPPRRSLRACWSRSSATTCSTSTARSAARLRTACCWWRSPWRARPSSNRWAAPSRARSGSIPRPGNSRWSDCSRWPWFRRSASGAHTSTGSSSLQDGPSTSRSRPCSRSSPSPARSAWTHW